MTALRVPREDWQRLQREAQDQGVTASFLLRAAVAEYLDGLES